MRDALIIDADATYTERLARILSRRNLRADIVGDPEEALARLRHRTPSYELVIVNVSDARKPWPAIVGEFQEASSDPNTFSKPLFLCISNREREPEFELAIERMGARYAFEQ